MNLRVNNGVNFFPLSGNKENVGLLMNLVKLQMLMSVHWTSITATSTLTVPTLKVYSTAPAELDSPEMDLPAQVCSSPLI